jgi:hypothetical protein
VINSVYVKMSAAPSFATRHNLTELKSFVQAQLTERAELFAVLEEPDPEETVWQAASSFLGGEYRLIPRAALAPAAD